MREGKLGPRWGYLPSPRLRGRITQCFLGGRTRLFPESGKETSRNKHKIIFFFLITGLIYSKYELGRGLLS